MTAREIEIVKRAMEPVDAQRVNDVGAGRSPAETTALFHHAFCIAMARLYRRHCPFMGRDDFSLYVRSTFAPTLNVALELWENESAMISRSDAVQ